jgi:hypothetical protein
MNSANCKIDHRPVDNSWARIHVPILTILAIALSLSGFYGYRQAEAKQARIDAACNQYEMNVAKVRLNPYLGDSSDMERPDFCPPESLGVSR